MRGLGPTWLYARTAPLQGYAMPRAFLSLIAAASFQSGPVSAATIYSNDFQSPIGAEWSYVTRYDLPTDSANGSLSTWLGRFGNERVALTLAGLTPGATYDVAFDLFIGNSMDGNANGAVLAFKDSYQAGIEGGATFLQTTFTNILPIDGYEFRQGYADNNPIGPADNPSQTGADMAYSSGVPFDWFNKYAIYYFGHGPGNPAFSFVASSGSATLYFQGIDMEAPDSRGLN